MDPLLSFSLRCAWAPVKMFQAHAAVLLSHSYPLRMYVPALRVLVKRMPYRFSLVLILANHKGPSYNLGIEHVAKLSEAPTICTCNALMLPWQLRTACI